MPRSFDNQAEDFDRRAGLPDDAIAKIVAAIGELTSDIGSGILLEAGAGTGQIGLELSRLRFEYVGFDNSPGMLAAFHERSRMENVALTLIHSDGNESWPVEDHSVSVIFSSRALHLLDPAHVVREVFRVASPHGAALITGTVVRPDSSPRSRMRKQMRRYLRDRGVEGRSGKKFRNNLLIDCCRQNAVMLKPTVAARWSVAYSPQQSLDSWREKAGLAGRDISEGIKADLLQQLEEWGRETFGDLSHCISTEETYVLEGVRIPAKR